MTRKFKKIPPKNWQIVFSIAMLWALCFRITALAGEHETSRQELQAALQEARIALQAAQQAAEEARTNSSNAEKEVQKVRSEYAALAIEARRREQELSRLRLGASNLLASGRESPEGDRFAVLVQILNDRVRQQRNIDHLLDEFEDQLATVLDVFDASDVLRRDIMSRLSQIQNAVGRQKRLSPEVAGRGDPQHRIRREARILAINDELNLVVIDAGDVHGVTPGSVWRIIDKDRVSGLLRVIAPRTNLSAAVPVEGKLDHMTPGLLVRRGRQSVEE